MNLDDNYFIIGIDGGASKTQGVLFTQTGETLANIMEKGTSLTANEDSAPDRIIGLITKLCEKAGIDFDYLDAVGLGLAGASNERARDVVFGKLDNLSISRHTLISSDVEAAFEVNCPGNEGILVSVGTGVIAMGRNSDGSTYRVGGLGHDKDSGSGYWIGKEAMLKIAIKENNVYGALELQELVKMIVKQTGENDFDSAVEKIMTSEKSVFEIASLAKEVLSLAESGNEAAMSIIQEATLAVSDLILELTHKLGFGKEFFLFSGNGSILKNSIYRKSLSDSLKFSYPNVKWTFSIIPPAYGAGLLAARFRDVPVTLQSIAKHLNENHADSGD